MSDAAQTLEKKWEVIGVTTVDEDVSFHADEGEKFILFPDKQQLFVESSNGEHGWLIPWHSIKLIRFAPSKLG